MWAGPALCAGCRMCLSSYDVPLSTDPIRHRQREEEQIRPGKHHRAFYILSGPAQLQMLHRSYRQDVTENARKMREIEGKEIMLHLLHDFGHALVLRSYTQLLSYRALHLVWVGYVKIASTSLSCQVDAPRHSIYRCSCASSNIVRCS